MRRQRGETEVGHLTSDPSADEPARRDLIERLSAARGGTRVISYVTSTRPFLEVQMAMDVLPIVYEHLRALPSAAEEPRIDLLIHSNGGEGVVPWRLVTLVREYCSRFAVLVPNRAFSAATLAALGADEVVMHPMGMLGPTDPTVTSEFNPPNPRNPQQLLGISVEDVASYIALVKEDVGIRHEDELVKAFIALTDSVHPLALGNVKRSTMQSKMLGESLLRLRRAGDMDEHDIREAVDKLSSHLYYHGHPINRQEARDALGLPFVVDAEPAVETAMWELYRSYAAQARLDDDFRPLQEAWSVGGPFPMPGPDVATSVSRVELGWVPLAFVESEGRCDVLEIEVEILVRRQWSGEADSYVLESQSRWRRTR